ncbi:response regulator transcription factor [Cohnella cellulosilytica]|uniref:Response regulator n=1 Tax=Cohnella cellulosilytica TaxID=986710 RepID=A0ABW2FLH7_9BACL
MWKIVIIDDERQVLQGMKRVIPWEDLNAEWAGEAMNGEDGLALIREVRPDIVITDIYMPIMNGMDMLEQLRKAGFAGKVIILSGYSDFEHARQALRLSVSDYVSKPISVPTLETILYKVIQELMEEEEKRTKQGELEQKLMLYEPFIEKEWVRAAVVGTLDHSYPNGVHMPEPYRYWTEKRHAAIGIDLVRDIRVNELSLSDLNLFRFAMSNIACEIAGELFPAFEYAELHSTRSVLIVHPEPAAMPQDKTQQKLEELAVRLIESLKGYLKMTIRVGIGSVKERWTDIPDSTEEAFRASDRREYRAVPDYEVYSGGGKEDGTRRTGAAVQFPVKFSYRLAGAIKAAQEEEAQRLVADYIAELKTQKGVTAEYLQTLGSELWGIIAYCLYEAGFAQGDLVANDQVAKELVGLTDAEQLRQWLSNKISLVCDSRQYKGNSKHRQLVDYMTDYIHEHYAEELTLAELADKVYVSRNHLSIIFKNITGETFNNYLIRVRIEKARELLLERRMLVYEVAEHVGYKNVPYFSTLFKKVTGMNPTELIK